MLDYYEKPKKKKKSVKDSEAPKSKPIRNFKIIDDDIDIRDLKANEEEEAIVDLLDADRPMIVTDYEEKPQVVQKVNYFTNNKWVKLDVCENEEGDLTVNQTEITQFKKRGGKSTKKLLEDDIAVSAPLEAYVDDDGDLDYIPRKKPAVNEDEDLSPVRRKPIKREKSEDLSPVRKPKEEEEVFDETKCRVKKLTKQEEEKKKKKEEKAAKYKEWGKGLVQRQQREEKIQEAVYEADKPLARYKDDRDLDRLLKKVEREDDPMLEYLRNKKDGDLDEDGMVSCKTAAKYRGPPPPLNRYNLVPGSRWDGVDRSNGFEKRYYESLAQKKAFQEQAYKWSVEDM